LTHIAIFISMGLGEAVKLMPRLNPIRSSLHEFNGVKLKIEKQRKY